VESTSCGFSPGAGGKSAAEHIGGFGKGHRIYGFFSMTRFMNIS
jgi:hypothetical protein